VSGGLEMVLLRQVSDLGI